MRGRSSLALAALSLGCSPARAVATPTPPQPTAQASSATPQAPKPGPAADAPKPPAPKLGDGFEVTMECAPEFCDYAAWVHIEFRNRQSNPLVLEVPGEAGSRDWTTADVTGEWQDDSGFGLGGSMGFCHAMHGGSCWAGTPVLVAAGAMRWFNLRFGEVQPLDLTLDVQIPWQQSATMSAADAQAMRKGWRIDVRADGPRDEGCVPVTCEITPTVLKDPAT